VKLLLVIGPGGGGTSLLTACLDGHPSIVMRSEYHSARTLIGDEDHARHPGLIWGNKVATEQFAS
jgi:hypothetical protein